MSKAQDGLQPTATGALTDPPETLAVSPIGSEMRDIEGIESVVAKLKPHWAAIDQHFEHENRIFIGLVRQPTTP